MNVHFTKAKGKRQLLCEDDDKNMVRNLSMESNDKDNNRMNKRKPKEEHIYELNGMTMEGKGSLWEMEFEMMSTPLG